MDVGRSVFMIFAQTFLMFVCLLVFFIVIVVGVLGCLFYFKTSFHNV